MKATCKNCGYQWEKGTDSNHSKDDCIERLKEINNSMEELVQDSINAYAFFNLSKSEDLEKRLENLTTEQGEL